MRTRIAWLSASGSEAAGVDGRAKVGGGVHGALNVELIHQSTTFGDSCDTRESRMCIHGFSRRSMPTRNVFYARFRRNDARQRAPNRSRTIDPPQSCPTTEILAEGRPLFAFEHTFEHARLYCLSLSLSLVLQMKILIIISIFCYMDISRIESSLFYAIERGRINMYVEFRESEIDAICRPMV